MPAASARLPLVDALRAFALLGILQVNIQSFVWSGGGPLGYLLPGAPTADVLTRFVLETWVVGKFMPLFALLLGFGMAVQWRAWGERGPQVLRRRYGVLLLLGVAHGTLLYYGDILTAYALCALMVWRYLRARPARLVRAARNWGLVYAGLTAVMLGFALVPIESAGPHGPAPGLPAEAVQAFTTYVSASYSQQWTQRVQDYLYTTFFSMLLGAPLIVALFLLGALAARQGWLRHPQRHQRVWRAALWVGLAGWVMSAAGAWLSTRAALHAGAAYDPMGTLLSALGVCATALYLALIVRWRDRPLMRAAIAWLAPAGRMPLTNYLMQSVLMGLLLSGWGLGLGAQWHQTELALLALGLGAAQLVVSRAWIARWGQGPVEAWWRWVTYGSLAAPRKPSAV